MISKILASALVLAAYDGEPGPNSGWFKSLQTEDGKDCCGVADCTTTDSKTMNGKYYAWIEEKKAFYEVPEQVILNKKDNPTGEAVVCYNKIFIRSYPSNPVYIYCFVRAFEG